MQKSIKRLIFTTLFIIALPLQTWAATDTDAGTQLTKMLSDFQSMTANFSQSVYDSKGSVLQRSSGNMALLRPGKFRWSIQKPMKQLLVTNGDTLWIYDVDLEQATQQPLGDSAQISPAQLLSGSATELAKAFIITRENRTDGTWFRLQPKQETNMFQWIELSFDNGKLKDMLLLDGLGQKTRLSFSNVVINPSLKNSLFKFTPPKGVDVIRENA